MTVVYWIHYPDHTDPFLQGYIGVSRQFDIRLKQHTSYSPIMRNRINKGAIVEVLHSFETEDQAFLQEETYRPYENIGWNINKGGYKPPSMSGKVAVANLLTGDTRTGKQKEASRKHSERMKGRTPWNKGAKGKQVAWNKGLSCKKKFL